MALVFFLDPTGSLWIPFTVSVWTALGLLGLLYSFSQCVLGNDWLRWGSPAPFLNLGQTWGRVYTQGHLCGIRLRLALGLKPRPLYLLPLPCPIFRLPPRLCSWETQPRTAGCCAGPVQRGQGDSNRNGEVVAVSRIFDRCQISRNWYRRLDTEDEPKIISASWFR